MMTDRHGKEYRTVGDIPIDPRETEYCVQFKAWLKSMKCDDWSMYRLNEQVEKLTPKNQMVLPMFPEWNEPSPLDIYE